MTSKPWTPLLGATMCLSSLAAGCDLEIKDPDRAAPGETACSSGISSFTVDDRDVPRAVLDAVYASGPIVGVDDPEYNPSLPLVIIPIAFPDLPHNVAATRDVIRESFFGVSNGSVADYFYESSWGQFLLREGGIADPVTLPKTPLQYSDECGMSCRGDWTRAPNVARDAATLANVNWPALDRNGDRRISRGEAQVFFLVSNGGGGANRPNVVTINTNFGGFTLDQSFVYGDAKRNDDPTRDVDTISYNYSTIWHELAHAMFNLPDRYTSDCGTGPTGAYDVMSDNCSRKHMNMHDRMKIGWIRPRALVPPSKRADGARHCYALNASEATPAALLLIDPERPSEYWLVENRHQLSSLGDFDSNLPESGIAVWHVNQSGPGMPVVTLVDASKPDGRPTFTDQSAGALFKPRPGEERDPASTFRGLFYRDGRLGYLLRGVSPSDAVMYVEL